MMNIVTGDETEVGACIMGLTGGFFPANLRNHARMPHCLQWGGMASLLGGLGDRFPQPNRYLPSKSPAACCGDLYSPIGAEKKSPASGSKISGRPRSSHVSSSVKYRSLGFNPRHESRTTGSTT